MQNLASKVVLSFFLLAGFSISLKAVPPISDFQLLKEKPPRENQHIHHHDVRFMRSSSGNFIVRNNPVIYMFGGMMYMYQQFISPQLPSDCLYLHHCSDYSKDLIFEYGLVKGVLATSDRLIRCNRLSALDIHPLWIDQQSGKVMEGIDIYKSRD